MFKLKKTFILIFFLAAVIFSANADLYNKSRPLYEIKTEHFKFIFPEESQEAAEYLAGIADEMYAEIAGKLRGPDDLFMPVVITPDSQRLNGYFSPHPQNKIVLYQAPILPNNGFVMFNNNLRKLFLHELTHALSLNIRSPFFRFFSGLFGDVVSPAGISASPVFVEGVTVLFESEDGYGRANQPGPAAIIQQDILENKFMSFHEAAGLRDYPGGSWYIYGGWFSRYLTETYGMEKYAALWHEFGNANDIHDFLFFRGAFSAVYDKKLDNVWEEFRQWMQIKKPVISETIPVTDNFSYIIAVASHDNYVYYNIPGEIIRYDSRTGIHEKIISSASANRIDVSKDGSRLMISTYRDRDGLPEAVIRIIDIESGKTLETIGPGLVEGTFAGDAVAASRINGYTMDLVLIRDEKETVLFKGSIEAIPSNPVMPGDSDIVFVLQMNGINRLARINLNTSELKVLKTDTPLNWLKNISSDGKNIYFIYDNDLTMYKGGVLKENEIIIQTVPLSGGVQFPVSAGDDIYYAGYFSDGHKLMKYPAGNENLEPESISFSWETLEYEIPSSVFPHDPSADFEVKKYSRFLDSILPQFWMPSVLIDPYADTFAGIFPGAGITALSIDPTEGYTWQLDLVYMWDNPFADFTLTMINDVLPLTLSLQIYDKMYYSITPGELQDDRFLGAQFTANNNIVFDPPQRVFVWKIDAGIEAHASGPRSIAPYSWNFDNIIIPFALSFAYQDAKSDYLQEDSRQGFAFITGYGGYFDISDFDLPKGYEKTDIYILLPFLNFKSQISAALSLHSDLQVSPAGAIADGAFFQSSLGYPGFFEYSRRADLAGSWYLYSDSSIGYSFKINRPLFNHTYIKSIDIFGGYRNAYAASTYLDSVYGQLMLSLFIDYGIMANAPFTIGFEISYAFQDNNQDQMIPRIILNIPLPI